MLWLKEITRFCGCLHFVCLYDIQMNPVKISHEQNTEHTHNKEMLLSRLGQHTNCFMDQIHLYPLIYVSSMFSETMKWNYNME